MRINTETCYKGLHLWTEDNIYTNPTTGHRTCRECKKDSMAKPPEERHRKGVNNCSKGHSYTPENTKTQVSKINGQRVVKRCCKQCIKDKKKTSVR